MAAGARYGSLVQLELVQSSENGYPGQKSHVRLEGRPFALCGVHGDGSPYHRRPDWWPSPDSEPSCGRCRSLLPQARTRAAALVPAAAPEPAAPLVVVVDWQQQLPGERAWGKPDFSGQQLLVLPQHTFADLAYAIWHVLEMGRGHESERGYSESFDDHNFDFRFTDGRRVVRREDESSVDYPRELVVWSDATVAATVGRGEQFDFTWDLGDCWEAMCRVAREPASVPAGSASSELPLHLDGETAATIERAALAFELDY